MQMLKKIFNSDSKYHLTLDETESSEPVQPAVKTAKTAATKPAEVASAKENGKAAIASNQTATQKSPKASAKGQVAQKEAQPVVKKSAASSYEPPFWVAAMNNTNNKSSSNGSGQGAEMTFATDNLMPTITKYRRVPGGSLAQFKAMAKTTKTPRR